MSEADTWNGLRGQAAMRRAMRLVDWEVQSPTGVPVGGGGSGERMGMTSDSTASSSCRSE